MTPRRKLRVGLLAVIGVAVLAYFSSQVFRGYQMLTWKPPEREGETLHVTPVAEFLLDKAVFGLTEDENEQFWAATNEGAYKIDLKNRTHTKVPLDFDPHDDAVYAAIRRGPYLVTSSWRSHVSQFDLASQKIVRSYKHGPETWCAEAVLSTNNKLLVVCLSSRPATAVVLTADSLSQADVIDGPRSVSFTAIAAHPTEEVVALGDTDGNLLRYHLGSRSRLSSVQIRSEAYVGGLAYSPDGKRLGVGLGLGYLGVLDEQDTFHLLSDKHEPGVSCVCFSPKGDYLLAGVGYDLCCWHIATRRRLNATVPNKGPSAGPVRVVIFSRDGSRILVGTSDRLAVYNAADVLK